MYTHTHTHHIYVCVVTQTSVYINCCLIYIYNIIQYFMKTGLMFTHILAQVHVNLSCFIDV